MKALIFVVAVGFTACGGLAQGQFSFGNKNLASTPSIDAKVSLPDGTRAAGASYWAQAYVKLAGDPDSSYAAVGQAVHFRTGSNAGYIVPVVLTTPFPGGTVVTLEMRAWAAALGDSFEEACCVPGDFWACVGKSPPVPLTVTEAPNAPPDMAGLSGFQMGALCCTPAAGITSQPSDIRAAVGGSVRLEVQVQGCPLSSIQWYRNGMPVPGATTRILRIASARFADAGDYRATVTGVGSDTSRSARLVVGYPLTLAANGPGRIAVQPAFEVFEPGQRVELTAIPSEGATFEGWQGDLSGTANPAALMVNGPKAVQAWFSRAPLVVGISRLEGRVRLEWTPPAVLQASDALVPGDWQDVSEAASPYDAEPTNAQRFYRLRRPRRRRSGKSGGGAREAFGVRRFTGALREPPRSKAALKRTPNEEAL